MKYRVLEVMQLSSSEKKNLLSPGTLYKLSLTSNYLSIQWRSLSRCILASLCSCKDPHSAFLRPHLGALSPKITRCRIFLSINSQRGLFAKRLINPFLVETVWSSRQTGEIAADILMFAWKPQNLSAALSGLTVTWDAMMSCLLYLQGEGTMSWILCCFSKIDDWDVN